MPRPSAGSSAGWTGSAAPTTRDAKGRVRKRGKLHLTWKHSKRYLATRRRKATRERKLAAHRKSLHGRLVHEIVAVGTTLITEQITYRARPQHFGKSVGLRAPGMFLDLLKPTVASTGGTGGSFHSTRSTKLSQFCHGCGQFVKKPLWQRWHACPCGIGPIQRDLSSAFLAAYLDVSRCSSLVCPVPGVPGRSGARPAGSIRAQHPTRKCGAAPASQLRYPRSETCVCPKVLAEPHKSRSPTGRGEAGNVEATRGTRPRLSPERSQHPTVGYHIVPTAKENSTVLKKLG